MFYLAWNCLLHFVKCYAPDETENIKFVPSIKIWNPKSRKFLHAKHRNWAVSASLVEDRAWIGDSWLQVHRCNRSATLPPWKAKKDGENWSHVQHAKEKRVRIGHDWYSFWLVDNRARSFLANQKAWLCKQSKRQFHSAENGCESLKVVWKLTLKKWSRNFDLVHFRPGKTRLPFQMFLCTR